MPASRTKTWIEVVWDDGGTGWYARLELMLVAERRYRGPDSPDALDRRVGPVLDGPSAR